MSILPKSEKILQKLFEGKVINFPSRNNISRLEKEKPKNINKPYDHYSLSKKLLRPSSVTFDDIKTGNLDLNHELIGTTNPGSIQHWRRTQDALETLYSHDDEHAWNLIANHVMPHIQKHFELNPSSNVDFIDAVLSPSKYGMDNDDVYEKHIRPKLQ